MWLYAAIRPRYGPGPKTALMAGLAWWVIVSLQSGKWVAAGFVPVKATLAPLATLVVTLRAILLAAPVGAWPYEE